MEVGWRFQRRIKNEPSGAIKIVRNAMAYKPRLETQRGLTIEHE